ncbi:MAG: choice-of-anchor J domain-containing protein [Pseudomonadota bacterium]
MKTFFALLAAAAMLPQAPARATSAPLLEQGFDDIGALSGWQFTKQGTPPGLSWFQGNAGIFPAQAGIGDTSYIAANAPGATQEFGSFAFRPTGPAAMADYMGIDSVSVSALPEPSAYTMLLGGMLILACGQYRSRRLLCAGAALTVLGLSQGSLAAGQGMVMVRDSETGAIRAITPVEFKALQAMNQRAQVSQAPQMTRRADGALYARVSDRAVYTVMTRGADGRLHSQCVSAENAAQAAANIPEKSHEDQ